MTLAASVLGPGGPVAAELHGEFEHRPEQVEMAAAVERTLSSRGRLMVEAGTGVGKTFAYLVPAIARCVLHRETVIVSTHTIALQEQLLARDIPLLARTLERWDPSLAGKGGLLRPVLVKGRGNYLSIRRLRLAGQRAERTLPDAPARRSLDAIERWAYGTRDGTLATLPLLERPGVWDRVQSDSGNCMGRRCPTYQDCFYQNARRAMAGGNLLVCNHALFFSDMALRARGAGFLPEAQHVILDEAHSIEDVASEQLGVSLSQGRVAHLLGTLLHARTGRGYLASLFPADASPAVDAAARAIAVAREASDRVFGALADLVRGGEAVGGRVRAPGAVENSLSPALRDLALRLSALRDAGVADADRYELNAYMERAAGIADELDALLGQSLPGCVYWVEVSPGPGRGERVTFACAPIEVGPALRERLFGGETSVVLTSATLATAPLRPARRPRQGAEDRVEAEEDGGARSPFAHVTARLGCDGAATLLLGSPFAYDTQVELHVDRSMPEPGGEAGAAYVEALVARILDHIDATGGGAFVLFTSFALLERTAAAIEAPLSSRGLPMLVQARDGPRGALLERFRQDGRSVLLGAASFWQGVDVRGQGLRNIIITRLPFDPPDRPLAAARQERIAERGGDPFMEDSLPRAVLRFRQGFGRLVRSRSDSGRVVVLDPRIATKFYGRAFLEGVPAGVRVVERRG